MRYGLQRFFPEGGAERSTTAAGDRYSHTAFEDGDGRAGTSTREFSYAVEADECASMCADEAVFLYALLEKLKRLAQKNLPFRDCSEHSPRYRDRLQ